jgi:glycosyltransferase involved in cell wall biosynthesis
MRILCFLHRLELGGVERTALRLCRQWHGAGIDVAVMLGRDGERMTAQAPELPCTVAPDPGFSTAWIETLWMIVWLPGIIRRTKPDILFCPGNSYTIVAVVMKLLLGRRCPPIVAKISNDLLRLDVPAPFRFFYHLWCLLQGRVIDRWVALSPAMAAESAVLLGVARGSVATIANPVLDADRHAALAKAGDMSRQSRQAGRRFLAAGRLAPQKGFDLLIDAFAQGAQPDDRLVIVGEGPERARLERRIRQLELQSRVQMPGHCHAIESHLACSDVLLLSSRYEGLPAVVVEAMAAGLAIVATDCCAGMRDLVEGSYPGVLVPPRSMGALSLAIATAKPLADPGERACPAAAFRVEPLAHAYQQLFAAHITAHPDVPMPQLIGEAA